MRIIRFLSDGKTHYGQPIDDRWARRIEGDVLDEFRVTGAELTIDKLLAPIVPTDILCIGRNYAEHAAESQSEVPKTPMLFIKASGTLNNPSDPIVMPRLSTQIDYEGELVVVIGKDAKYVTRDRAMDFVFGYTCGNDVTARDWQRNKDLGGGQFARGKSFDGFCPLGPAILTQDEIADPGKLRLRTYLNGSVMQDDTTDHMMFDVPALIESLSSTLTLRKGAIIMTGTPPGVGFARNPPIWLKAGDTIEVEIEKLGRLSNPVVQERLSAFC